MCKSVSRIMVAVTALMTHPCSAHAEYNWSGLYFGSQVGTAIWDAHLTTDYHLDNPYYFYRERNNFDALDFAGLSIGGFGGINSTLGNSFLVGIQAGASSSLGQLEIDGQTAAAGSGFNASGTVEGKLSRNWAAEITARLGHFISPSLLAFAVFGIEVAEFEIEHVNGASVDEGSTVGTALLTGAGLEFAITDQWRAQLEYRLAAHKNVSIDSATSRRDNTGTTFVSSSANLDINLHQMRLGVVYQLPSR
ncbi:MAG: outer membrane beta-barrel protein [Hyphomicrobiaceae bacterium]|nr:outer membrane beta-barrel protein [Hyphomicrobiaceae bacterium]